MTITGSSPEHDLKATNDGDISNPPAQDPHSTGGINSPRSSHKTASRPSCPATDEHSVLHDGARIMTMPAIPRSNPLIPSTSVSSHHGKDADFDLSSMDSDHDDDDQLKNKGCRDRSVFSTDSNDDNSDDLKGARLFSPKKLTVHQKRARTVREAAEVNEETPRKRSRLNSGPNNDASDSAIGLGDESNHYSTRVEPAQLDARHAWDKKKCMGEAADRVKKELDVLLYVEANFAEKQDLEEAGLIGLVQEKKKKVREIEADYDHHIAEKEHVVAQAAEAAQKCTDRVGKKNFEFKECLGQVDRASADYEEKKFIVQRLQFAAMIGAKGMAVDVVACKLGIEPEAIFRGASTPDLRSVFGVDTLQDIVNTDYKILVKTIARPLISGGHEKGKGIREIVNARNGGSCKTKRLKQMLFEIFFRGQEHPELSDRGKLV
jgi:hypothetical protein